MSATEKARKPRRTRASTGDAKDAILAAALVHVPFDGFTDKVLEKAGLISRGREAQWRPRSIQAEPLKDAADWLEQYRRFWEQSLDRLEEHLAELQGKAPIDEPNR